MNNNKPEIDRIFHALGDPTRRAMLARLSRAGLLPRDMPEVEALAACLAEAGVIDGELAAAAGPGLLADTLLRVRDFFH